MTIRNGQTAGNHKHQRGRYNQLIVLQCIRGKRCRNQILILYGFEPWTHWNQCHSQAYCNILGDKRISNVCNFVLIDSNNCQSLQKFKTKLPTRLSFVSIRIILWNYIIKKTVEFVAWDRAIKHCDKTATTVWKMSPLLVYAELLLNTFAAGAK